MKLTRFCSKSEFDKLMSGETNDKMYDIVHTLDNIKHTLNQFLIHYATKN